MKTIPHPHSPARKLLFGAFLAVLAPVLGGCRGTIPATNTRYTANTASRKWT